MLEAIKKFLGPAHGSLKGVINVEEFHRSIMTAVGSSVVTGAFFAIIQALLASLLAHVPAIFSDPMLAAVATMALTALGDIMRRQSHGEAMHPKDDPTGRASATVEVPTEVNVVASDKPQL